MLVETVICKGDGLVAVSIIPCSFLITALDQKPSIARQGTEEAYLRIAEHLYYTLRLRCYVVSESLICSTHLVGLLDVSKQLRRCFYVVRVLVGVVLELKPRCINVN